MRRQSAFRSRLAMSPDEFERMILQLDDAEDKDHPRRRDVRHRFCVTDIPMTILQGEGGQLRFLAHGRNLSAHGIAVLHGGYVHVGSECNVVLRQREGSPIVVTGDVSFCRLVEGSCHEIGIRFRSEIDPSTVPGVQLRAEPSESDDAAEPAIGPLQGTVLLADGWAASGRVLARQLETLGLSVRLVPSSGAALDVLAQESFDVLLLVLGAGTEHGRHALHSARDIDRELPIVMLLDDPADYAGALRDGATDCILRPYPFDLLYAVMRSHLDRSEPADRLYSTAAMRPGMIPIVHAFVRDCHGLVPSLRTAVRKDDRPELRRIACRLRAVADAVGFSDLTMHAVRVLRDLESRTSIRESGAALLQSIESLATESGRKAA